MVFHFIQSIYMVVMYWNCWRKSTLVYKMLVFLHLSLVWLQWCLVFV